MKFIKALTVVCILAAASYTTAYAQSYFKSIDDHTTPEDNKKGDEGKVNRGAYLTNAWYDNWSFGIAGGAQGMFANGNYGGATSENYKSTVPITGEIEINITKWLTPSIGLRLGYQGAWIRENRLDDRNTRTWYNHYKPTYDDEKGGYLFNNMYIHGDVLLGLSNLIGGYKETRVLTVWPYVHAGYYRMSDPNYNYFWPINKEASEKSGKNEFMSDREFAFGPGVLLNFRLNNNWSATFDVRDVLLAGRYHNPENGQGVLGDVCNNLSVSVGITYTIKKWYWDRYSSAAAGLEDAAKQAQDALKDVQAQNDDLNKKNDDLNKANDDLNKKNDDLNKANDDLEKKNKDLEDELLNRMAKADVVFFYDLDQEKLNATESFRLEQYLVKTLTEEPKHVFYLTGSADKGTGTLKRNLYLSKVRAYNIKNILIKDYGVPESQIVIKASIVTDTHEDGRLDRCVLIESE